MKISNQINMSLTIATYSTKSFVVRGETETYKADLTAMGGKLNKNLKEGVLGGFSQTATRTM